MINIPKEYDGLIDLKIIGNFSHNSSLDSNTKGVSIMHYYVLCRNTSSVKKCIKSGVNIYRIDQEFSNNWINIGDIHTSKPLEIVDGYWTILAFISSGGVNRAFPAMVSAVTYLNNTSDRSIYLDTISVKSNIFTDIDNINFSDVYYQNVTLDSTEISYTVPVENNYIYVINKQITCVGSNGRWLNIKGPTEKRGSYDGNTMNKEDRGFQYYDTTLNKPIWWNGTNWVDATGATV